MSSKYLSQPLLVQELVQHQGVILKTYVLLPHTTIQQRESIPDLRAGTTSFTFDSQLSLKSQAP